MNLKTILIVGAVAGIAYYLYTKKKTATVDAPVSGATSNINGAQLEYVLNQ